MYTVTPLVGVWIEIFLSFGLVSQCLVTPLVGVWIEILQNQDFFARCQSLPLWECGLKFGTVWKICPYSGHSPCGSVD